MNTTTLNYTKAYAIKATFVKDGITYTMPFVLTSDDTYLEQLYLCEDTVKTFIEGETE